MQTEDHQSCPCNQVFNSISDKDCLQNTDKLLVVAGWPTSTLLVCSSVLSMFDDMSNIESLFIGNCEEKKKIHYHFTIVSNDRPLLNISLFRILYLFSRIQRKRGRRRKALMPVNQRSAWSMKLPSRGTCLLILR